MSDIVDLDTNAIANAIYDLQRLVENEPAPDDVSRGDWNAIRIGTLDLLYLVEVKMGRRQP